MFGRLSITAVVLALATAAAAADRNALEQHLMRLTPGAKLLGRTQAEALVQVVVGLPWRNRAELDRLITDLANPQSPRYQRFLTPPEFERRFAPRPAQIVALTRFLRTAGLESTETSRSRLLITAVGRASQVERALATQLVDVLDGGRRLTVTSTRPTLPPELGAQVVAVGAGPALGSPPQKPTAIELPLDPGEVARLYAFDEVYDSGITGNGSRASTIAIATAFGFDRGDLQRFWSEMGIARPLDSVELISVGGLSAGESPDADQLETTLDVEWATAMAPGAKVLVYAGADAAAHTFLRIYDRIVSDNRAAVLTTSWGRCEADHPDSFLSQVDAVFARAAAQGITVIAASGDRGAFDCPDAGAPSVTFPASHPYVLATGGTSLRRAGDDLEEVVWAGSGGGLSGFYSAPPWQMTGDRMRAMSDVSLNADPHSGYHTFYQGSWHVLGGTSVSAPIWAALTALINQSRATVGRGPLGLAAPLFCEVALASDFAAPAFLDITAGDNGAYSAGPGFDLPTGWGVPHAGTLARALTDWTPPADGRGGSSELIPLAPVSPSAAGRARLRFRRRCLSTSIELQVRRLPPGSYTVDLDGAPVASFSPDARGAAILRLTGLDLRGHRVGIASAGGGTRFSSAPGEDGPPVVDREISAELINTGMMPAARGSLEYRASSGRDQLTVRASGLPNGTYQIRLGGETIGTLTGRDGASAVARFDSLGTSGQRLRTNPLCKPVILSRNGVAYLRSALDALAPGECS
jgi:kumamolisin